MLETTFKPINAVMEMSNFYFLFRNYLINLSQISVAQIKIKKVMKLLVFLTNSLNELFNRLFLNAAHSAIYSRDCAGHWTNQWMNHFGELIQKIRDTEKLTSHLDDDEWSSRERERVAWLDLCFSGSRVLQITCVCVCQIICVCIGL